MRQHRKKQTARNRLLIPLTLVALAGCGPNETVLQDSFIPPVETLADVDSSDTKYQSGDSIVQGVISPAPQSGSIGDDYETYYVTLDVWRDDEGAGEQPLTLLIPTKPGGSYRELPAYSIARFRVLLSETRTRAIVKQILEPALPDDEFRLAVKKMKQPLTATHPTIGKMTYDKSLDWFEAQDVAWQGHNIEVLLNVMPDEFDKYAYLIDAIIKTPASWQKRLDERAIADLLPLANKWRDEGDPDLTSEELLKQVKPKSLSIYDDGSFEFWFSDGGVFGGHSIRFEGTVKEGPKTASIAG